MSGHEQAITTISLTIVAVFYVVTMFFFIISERTRLNWSLAVQKCTWFTIIISIALPAYSGHPEHVVSARVRSGLFVFLAIVTLWVLFEVYSANKGRIKWRIKSLAHGHTWNGVERRSGYDRRKQVSE